MARIKLKPWMAPLATLQLTPPSGLDEGEVGIVQETFVFVKRPDGDPAGALIYLGDAGAIPTPSINTENGHLIFTMGNGGTIDAGNVAGQGGVGILSAAVTAGHLILTLTNSGTIDAGSVAGPTGPAGTGDIISATVNGSGHLILQETSGTIDVGSVAGPTGPAGTGDIISATVNGSGHLILQKTSGTIDAGNVVGSTGPAGSVGIAGAAIQSPGGHLILTLTNSTTIDCGDAVGPMGPSGVGSGNGITGAVINGGGHLQLAMSNGTTIDCGSVGVVGPVGTGVVGATLVDGHLVLTLSNEDTLDCGAAPPGPTGASGVGVAGASINGDDHLILTLSNTSTIDAGSVGTGYVGGWTVGRGLSSATTVPPGTLNFLSGGMVFTTAATGGSVGPFTGAITGIALDATNGQLMLAQDGGTLADMGVFADTSYLGGPGLTSITINGAGHLIFAVNGSQIEVADVMDGVPNAPGGIIESGVHILGFAKDPSNGHLVVSLSDSTTIDAGNITNGAGVTGGGIDDRGHFILALGGAGYLGGTDTIESGSLGFGSTIDCGIIGTAGPAGVGVTDASINGSGNLILTLSNAGTIDAGAISEGFPLPTLASGIGQWATPIVNPGVSGSVVLPSGGTWAWFVFNGGIYLDNLGGESASGISAGGSTVLTAGTSLASMIGNCGGVCWRIG